MKIYFPDKSYIEMVKSPNPDKFIISIAAKSLSDPMSLVINSVEVDEEQLKKLMQL